jgi:hypothetical protein
VSRFQSLIILSLLPLTIVSPSGLRATQLSESECMEAISLEKCALRDRYQAGSKASANSETHKKSKISSRLTPQRVAVFA